MSIRKQLDADARVFSLSDWIAWLNEMAGKMFGLSASEFESSYAQGLLSTPSARDLGSILPIIQRLRASEQRRLS
jgi:hypothetical protein